MWLMEERCACTWTLVVNGREVCLYLYPMMLMEERCVCIWTHMLNGDEMCLMMLEQAHIIRHCN